MKRTAPSDGDIRQLAKAMLNEHGANAFDEAMARANRAQRQGDAAEHDLWARIAAAIRTFHGSNPS